MPAAGPQGPEILIASGAVHIGDRVVYPNQGICRVRGIEHREIAGRSWEFVTLSREEDGATVMVPREKVAGVGLRRVASDKEIELVFDFLSAPGGDPELDWKVRHRAHGEKMVGGELMGTTEVLKGLHALARLRPLPQKERELYDNARHLLVQEIAAAMSLAPAVAEDNLDYALVPPDGMKRKGRTLIAAQPLRAVPPTLAAIDGEEDLEDAGGTVELPGLEDEEAVIAEPAVEDSSEADQVVAPKKVAAKKKPVAKKTKPAPKSKPKGKAPAQGRSKSSPKAKSKSKVAAKPRAKRK